jgi:translation initiation factor IF-3
MRPRWRPDAQGRRPARRTDLRNEKINYKVREHSLAKVPVIIVVGKRDEMLGVVSTRDALTMAAEVGLDLVEISPTAVPPVCKILDYGKFKYEAQKRKNEAKKKQKVIEVKEIKMRPGIDTHDYDVKMRAIKSFLEEGDKVKVTMRFRGREMMHQELGLKVLDRVRTELDELIKVESHPKLEGRQMIMTIAPK